MILKKIYSFSLNAILGLLRKTGLNILFYYYCYSSEKARDYLIEFCALNICKLYVLCTITCHFAYFLNPLTTNVLHRIDPSQLIWNANQSTGFYMMRNIGR